MQPVHSLLSCNVDDILGVFSVLLLGVHEAGVTIPGTHISLKFSPKVLWELMLLGCLPWKYQLSLWTLGTVLIQG